MKYAIIFAAAAMAHMTMKYPSPFYHPENPKLTSVPWPKLVDYSYSTPLNADASNYPCKGYHHAKGPYGQTVIDLAAGQSDKITISGGAFHSGGSCQISLSYDKGKTFRVIKSFIGSCPISNGDTDYAYTVPSDAPSADKAILAWSWNNAEGNRELYMNCAAVSIKGSGSGSELNGDKYPEMYVGNLDGYCVAPERHEVVYPLPGDDVEVNHKLAEYKPPTDCKTVSDKSKLSPPRVPGGALDEGNDGSDNESDNGNNESENKPSSTSTKPAGSSTSPAASSNSPSKPQPTSGSCKEGTFRCVDETHYNQCQQDGTYHSANQPVAPGTKCVNGEIVHA